MASQSSSVVMIDSSAQDKIHISTSSQSKDKISESEQRAILCTSTNVDGEGPEYFLMSLVRGEDEDLLYMYGGENNKGLLSNVLHVLDPHLLQWKQISWKKSDDHSSNDFPPKVEGHSMSFVKVGERKEIIFFGGLDNMRLSGYGNTLFALDVNSLKWEIIQAQSSSNMPHDIHGRRQHAAVCVGSKLYVFGGEMLTDMNEIKLLDDLIVFDRESCTWSSPFEQDQPIVKPPPMRGHSMLYDGGSNLYVYGGKTEHTYSDQMWRLNIENMKWELIEPSTQSTTPKGREMHSAILLDNIMYFYGGWSQRGPTNELISFNLEDRVWKHWKHSLSQSKDSIRFGHCAAIVNSNQLVVLGGRNHLFQNQPGVLTFSLQKGEMDEMPKESANLIKPTLQQVIELDSDEKILLEKCGKTLSQQDALDVTKYKTIFSELTEQQIKFYEELAIILASQAETAKEVKELLEQNRRKEEQKQSETENSLKPIVPAKSEISDTKENEKSTTPTTTRDPPSGLTLSPPASSASPSKPNKKNKKKKKK
ncbi:hypothetical protein FDP41_008877 [Naegleria fowleri]|uniref:DUF4110 domain-containing protein n=1 Tax=Naegleria fowleri TaxID=5763 RepID=A0A6A5BF94_NAEFO|nr:uncharacterized protein FDP41_008877 [Naegleria fowleri]KAF0972628.1 hypothetical protein FDP41_008877 [Naegleria fowleri]CAG4718683.1 unnamed protein product [Naegleria fowleri]